MEDAMAHIEGGMDFNHRHIWRRLLDFVLGYDFFISYRWKDGQAYSNSRWSSLKEPF
jgi:hypothetical protein